MNMQKGFIFIVGLLVGIIITNLTAMLFEKKKNEAFRPAVVSSMKETLEDTKSDTSTTTDSSMEAETNEINKTDKEGTDTMIPASKEGSEAITVGVQSAGDIVTVQSVTMPKLGWVVVHEVKGGALANALGARRVDAGVSTDVIVRLLRGIVAGGDYMVVLYNDNGDKIFDIKKDRPLTNTVDNQPMSAQFIVK